MRPSECNRTLELLHDTNETKRVIAQLNQRNSSPQERAKNLVDTMRPGGTTNLWDGTRILCMYTYVRVCIRANAVRGMYTCKCRERYVYVQMP